MTRYDDIINLPHHKSEKRQPMTNYDRAAQFAPFAALTGYDDAIAETARVTDEKIELTEEMIAELDASIRDIAARIDEKPQIEVTFFRPDAKKQGGEYVTRAGAVRKIDPYNKIIVFDDGFTLPFANIISIN